MKTKVITTVLVAGAFFIGYQYAAALYGEDIAALREDYATRAQALEVKYREKERGYAQSLVDAWNARDAALARVDALAGDVERVRKQADAYRRRLSEAADNPCKPCQVELARCAGLLERGAEVAGRCGELAQRIAVDKDAVVGMIK